MQPETAEEIEMTRAKLIEAEESGMSDRSVDEIWEQARREVTLLDRVETTARP